MGAALQKLRGALRIRRGKKIKRRSIDVHCLGSAGRRSAIAAGVLPFCLAEEIFRRKTKFRNCRSHGCERFGRGFGASLFDLSIEYPLRLATKRYKRSRLPNNETNAFAIRIVPRSKRS